MKAMPAEHAAAIGDQRTAPTGKPIYTCPMHPEVQQDHPGNCPKCGMTLELRTVTAGADDQESAELRDMTRRFWIGAALALPVFVLAMAHLIPASGQAALGGWRRLTLDSICARHARGLVGRLAVIARVAGVPL